jgi:hypothetical protein
MMTCDGPSPTKMSSLAHFFVRQRRKAFAPRLHGNPKY